MGRQASTKDIELTKVEAADEAVLARILARTEGKLKFCGKDINAVVRAAKLKAQHVIKMTLRPRPWTPAQVAAWQAKAKHPNAHMPEPSRRMGVAMVECQYNPTAKKVVFLFHTIHRDFPRLIFSATPGVDGYDLTNPFRVSIDGALSLYKKTLGDDAIELIELFEEDDIDP